MKKTPLEYGKQACDAIMHRFTPQELPPEGSFFYHQGVFLSGMQNIYKLCGEEKYFQYVKDYVDSVIGPKGEVIGFCHELTTPQTPDLARRALTMLDHKQPSILLYDLLDRTGDSKYERAIKTIAESMYFWPVNQYGGYWHMMTQHNQMWLDGAYMAGPLSVMYAQRYGDDVLRDRAIKQIFLMNDYLKDEKTGLYFHGWDPSPVKEPWADPETGLSANIWGRAVGWYIVAILDMLDYIPAEHSDVPRMKAIAEDLLQALADYQDPKTGMWFEVVDKIDRPDNWVESSCTSLFIYAYAKAIREGILSEEYAALTEKAYRGLEATLYYDEDGYLVIDNICIGTCIDPGTYEHYIGRQIIKNDLHGGGAFTLMCAEMERFYEYRLKKDKLNEK